MGVVARWVDFQFHYQILLGCCETKLLICHKGGGSSFMGGGGRWGGGGVD